jgi:hypothetical protein
MSRRSRSEQARINGAKSRGPKTARGKAISSLNALKHGRFAKHTTCLFFESSEDYDQLVDDLRAQFRPATNNEHRLVEQLASIQFDYERARSAQTTYLERLLRYAASSRLEIPPTANPMDALVAAEEEALARSPYLKFKTRQMSQLLTDQNRVIHALKSCKRDFPALTPEPQPAPAPDPEIPILVVAPESFEYLPNVDIFPKRPAKSNTFTSICPHQPIGTNPPFPPPQPPQSPTPIPSTPPIDLPKAA